MASWAITQFVTGSVSPSTHDAEDAGGTQVHRHGDGAQLGLLETGPGIAAHVDRRRLVGRAYAKDESVGRIGVPRPQSASGTCRGEEDRRGVGGELLPQPFLLGDRLRDTPLSLRLGGFEVSHALAALPALQHVGGGSVGRREGGEEQHRGVAQRQGHDDAERDCWKLLRMVPSIRKKP